MERLLGCFDAQAQGVRQLHAGVGLHAGRPEHALQMQDTVANMAKVASARLQIHQHAA